MIWTCQRCKKEFEQETKFQGTCECGGPGKPQKRYGAVGFRGTGWASREQQPINN